MKPIELAKLHATGNDFLVLGPLPAAAGDPGPDLAAALCDRHRGVGADGLLTLRTPAAGSDVDCTMSLRNADGGSAEVSGNGLRCLAHVAARAGLGGADGLVVATDAGRRDVRIERDDRGEVVAAEVDMGPVTFEPHEIPLTAASAFGLEATFHGVTYRGDAAGMGNPHLVVLVDDVGAVRVPGHGPRLETDERFPERTNVEFVAVTGPDTVALRVWERGVGETLSCGTGACAAAAVLHRHGMVGSRVHVDVPGGRLTVTMGDTIRLGGPVRHVFDVTVDPARLDAGAPARTGSARR